MIVPSQARGVGFGALALVALASLAGCSVYENLFGSKIPPPACPGVSVLADGATLIKFRSGDGRDLTDVLYSGEILGIDATCAYERDRETLVGSVTVELTIDVRAERGPADRQRRAVLPYFVGLVDDKRRLVDKKPFEIEVEFPGNLSRIRFRDDPPISLTIPLKADQRGDLYQVYVGFQLTEDELEFSRKRQSRR